MKDIRAHEGMSWSMMFAFIAMALIALLFMVPGSADAHMGQAGTSKVCMECHSTDHTSPSGTGQIDIAVNGVVTTSATLINDGVDTIEIDWKYYNMANGTPSRDSKGVLIGLPTGAWTLANGTANSPAITGWNSVWDAGAGVGWDAAFQTNSPANCGSGAHNCYKINFGGTAWDHDSGGGGNDNTLCDLGPAACGAGFNDLDGVADTMGVDAVISTTAAPGPYTIYVYGIGHDAGGTKGYIVGIVNVTVSAGADVTAPTTSNIQVTANESGTYVGDPFDLSGDLTDNESNVTACEYCVKNGSECGAADTWAAGSLSGSSPTWTCSATGVAAYTAGGGFTDADSIYIDVRGTSSGGTNSDGGTSLNRTMDKAATAIADLASSGNTSNSVDLSWSDPVDGGSGNASYDVRYVTGASFIEAQWAGAVDPGGEPTPPTTGMTVGSLSPSTQYTFAIKTTDNLGNQAAISNTVTVTTDAGNTPPTLSISLPNGDTVAEGTAFNITYTMSDPEEAATVNFFYDTDNVGADGTAITECANQAEGTGATCPWNTTGEAGTWYVYGIADDGVNTPVTSYSPGTLTVNAPPTIAVNQPDGAGDTVIVGTAYNIDYNLADTDDVVTASFYYDTDNIGLDGTAITGACATAVEGTGATCSWDTTGVTPGSYYVYGTTSDGVSPAVSDYSPGQITIEAEQNPNDPTGHDQYYTDDVLIKTGWIIRDTSVKIKATVSDNNSGQQVELEVDIQDNGVGYDGVADCTSGLVANGSIATATCSGLVNGTQYKWQVRASDENGNKSNWVDYGAGFTVKTAMDLGVDAGPNTPPTITVNQPSGNVIAEGTTSFNINYDLSDPDNAATVAFYYDVDSDMTGGTPAVNCGSAPEGTGVDCAWNTSGVAPGTYWVYGDADDGVNPVVQDLSPGTITINAAPTLSVSQPDGVSDSVVQGGSYNVAYTLGDTDDVVTVAFYYDMNNSGLDGTAISGACASAAEGTGVTCSWDTSSVTPGSYYVYGLTSDGVNPQVSAYSTGQITVTANQAPTITVNQPDGTGDTVTAGALYDIDYNLADVDDIVTAAFYYDTDAVGLDGTAISGACAAAAEAATTCSWDTTGVTPGSYYVYGITDDGINAAVNDYSPGQITINPANNPPTLSISQPDGVGDSVVAGDPYNITYTMTDAEDIATVAFYYDTDNSGQDGTAISGPCASAAEGTGATCTWDTGLPLPDGVPGGIYYIYGIADDGVNTPVVVYSSGTIEIGGELVTNHEFNTTANWTINLDTGTVNATCAYDASTDHTGDGSGSVKGHEEGQDNTFKCTITQDISSIVTKNATISTASVWTLFSSNFEAAGDSVTIDLTTPATIPADTATNIALDSDVTINFSEDVECATVTNTNITMTPAPATSWSVFSCSGGQVVMRPVGQVNNTSYTVDVTVNVQDLAGNPGAAYSFSYTTEP